MVTYACPVCGWPELTQPWIAGQDGGAPETCPSCGFEFGTGDDSDDRMFMWRLGWIAEDMPWRSTGGRPSPPEWDPDEQLQSIVDDVPALGGPFTCPVCGYPALREPPRSASGGGSHDICPSCGFQFGYTDDDQGHSYEQWRTQWVARGMPWRSRGIEPPEGWDPRRQLAAILGND